MMIAAGLGVVGAICNWFYVSQQARDLEKVSFVAVKSDAQINTGDVFEEAHLEQVQIPQRHLGNLEKSAVGWEARNTVVGMKATKGYFGGEIVLQQDVLTEARRDPSELLGPDEGLLWVPVDQNTFVPGNVNPGDRVSFLVTREGGGGSSGPIGPFEILTLGDRKGRREFQQGRRTGSTENVIGIRVSIDNSQLDPQARALSEALSQTRNATVQVLLHSRAEGQKNARR